MSRNRTGSRRRSSGNSSKGVVQPQNVLNRQQSWGDGQQTLEKQEKQQADKEVVAQYLEAFTVLFSRVNSILAVRQIKCELSNNYITSSWKINLESTM